MTPVEQIKSKLSIIDVVGSYIKLEKAGGSYKALCPFHSERTPSFNVSPSRDAYYCFGCNRGGDIFTFVEEIEGVDFTGALKLLADRAGVELRYEHPEARSERDRLFAIMEEAADYYQSELAKHAPALAYLMDRGLEEKTIRGFRIGLAPLEWRHCYQYLKGKGFLDKEIELAGLTKPVEGKGYYDRFRGRIMFPIFDANGRVIAFSGRIFLPAPQSEARQAGGDQKNPDLPAPQSEARQAGGGQAAHEPAKYINSPETPLYDKSSVMFGYDRAKQAIRKQNFTVVVEGQMDLIMAHQAGSANTVAVSGTALTEKHLALLKRLSDNLVFAFDADDAGLRATERAFAIALQLGMSVRVAAIPSPAQTSGDEVSAGGSKDPADYIKSAGPGAWQEVIASSKHIIDFFIDTLAKRALPEREFRAAVERTVLPLVLSMRSKIEQAHFIVEVARKLGISETAVWEEVGRLRAMGATAPSKAAEGAEGTARPPRIVKTRRQVAEEEILGIIHWQEGHAEPAIDAKRARDMYHGRLTQHGFTPWEPDSDLLRVLLFKAENTYEHGPGLLTLLEELLDTLEREILRERQSELLRKITDAKLRGAKEEELKYLEEFQSVGRLMVAVEDREGERGS